MYFVNLSIDCLKQWRCSLGSMEYFLFLFVSFGIFYSGQGDVTDPCPFWTGAPHASGKCFKLFTDRSLNFKLSQDVCKSQGEGVTLAEMVTKEQVNTVKSILHPLADNISVYVGLYAEKGQFKWLRSQIPVFNDSILWAGKDEPNKEGWDEKCVGLGKGGLFDIGCKKFLNGTICQRDEIPVTNPCYFWEAAAYVNNKCFKSFTSPSTWQEALGICRNQGPGGTLAELYNVQESNVAVGMLESTQTQTVWLGYTDIQTESTFLWTSTNLSIPVPVVAWELVLDTINSTHATRDCVGLTSNTSAASLRDFSCATRLNFTCQLPVSSPCDGLMPFGVEYFQGHCFLFVHNKDSWSEAQSYCMSIDGFLTEPTSVEFQKYVRDMASRYSVEPAWIGGFGNTSIVKWATSGEIIQDYLAPRDSCYLRTNGASGDWLCGSYSEQRFSICEKVIGDPCETFLPGAFYSQGQCFKYFSTPVTWLNAQKYCQEKDAFLAEPESESLSQAINLYLRSLKTSTVWIGGGRVDTEAFYQWMSSGNNLTFSLLEDDPADNVSDNFLVIQNASFWSQKGGDAVYPFVCQSGVKLDKANYRTVTAVFPQLQNVSDLEAYLQVTCNVRSHRVSLRISVHKGQGEVTENTTQVLEPAETFHFSIDSRLLLTSSGVYSGYVLLESSWPVTCVLYIHSPSQGLDASTLLLPSHIVQREGAEDSSYFLVSGSTETHADNVLAAVTLGGSADVTVLFKASSDVNEEELSLRGITFSWLHPHIVICSQQTKTKAKTQSQFGSLLLKVEIDFDGAYVSSPDNLAVFVGGGEGTKKNDQSDFTLDQVLPVEFLGRSYFTFPSPASDVNDFVKVVAVASNTNIKIQGGGKTDNLVLKKPGDVAEISVKKDEVIFLEGDTVFYAFKFSQRNRDDSSCMTSLYSYELWKHQYDFAITSRLNDYNIYIFVIVSTNYTSNLTMDNFDTPPECSVIQGTPMSRCSYNLPVYNHTYYHLYITNFQERFGAYLIAFSNTSALCHALGVRDNVQPTFIIDRQDLLDSLQDNPPCETVTTYEATDTTAFTFSTTASASDIDSSDTTSIANSVNSSPVGNITSFGLPYSAVDNKYLFVDVKKTSAYKRAKTSAHDKRVSSKAIGSLGIICISVIFGVIVLGDATTFLKFIEESCKRR